MCKDPEAGRKVEPLRKWEWAKSLVHIIMTRHLQEAGSAYPEPYLEWTGIGSYEPL